MTEDRAGKIVPETDDAGEMEMCYPEVVPDVTAWAYSDERPPNTDAITVTVHGLRRLLRIVDRCQKLAMGCVLGTPMSKCGTVKLLNATSAIWCEGDLVMSGLFLEADGQRIDHPDAEIYAEGVPPWERPAPTEQKAEKAKQ